MNRFWQWFLIGIVLAIGYSYWKTNKATIQVIPQNKTEKKFGFSIEQPPKNSIKGAIETMSGRVKWESRIATAPSEIIKPVTISQGEILETGEDGNTIIIFKDITSIILSPKSKLFITQTLPDNFVFDQKFGLISFEKLGKTPISVRALHMLSKINSGKIILSINSQTGEITIDAKKGLATIGFNNIDNVSTVVDIPEGTTLIYNDETRETSTE